MEVPRFTLITLMIGAAVHGQHDALTTCSCTQSIEQQWKLPAPGAAAQQIASVANSSLCWQLAKTVGSRTCDGLCVYLGACSSPETPTWQITSESGVDLVRVSSAGPAQGWCLDQNTVAKYVQAYACEPSDTHQTWAVQSAVYLVELWDGAGACVAEPGAPSVCPAPVPPGAQFCPKYHTLQGPNLYDPSGPLQTPDGVWHVWEDDGSWAHYTSRDLLRWTAVQPPAGFGGLTGSTSPTPSGVYAFYPEGSQGGVMSAVARDAPQLTQWSPRGQAFAAPSFTGTNFRDPARAFEWAGAWYVGVGCNNNSHSADLCLFRAADDTLAQFEFAGSMFTAHATHGQMNSDIVWVNQSVPATMMECPDIFPLGSNDTWMLIGSLFSTNQWWIGTVAGTPPRFTASSVGLMDYGNGYAAKTGSTYAGTGEGRRVSFAFTGWSEPSKVPACGRAMVLPRDITLAADGLGPRLQPIPETQSLRNTSSHMSYESTVRQTAPGSSLALVAGAQVSVSVVCRLPAQPPASGRVAVQVLSTTDQKQYTEVGYDFAAEGLYTDHTHCCQAPNTVVQRAPTPRASLAADGLVNITVFVDGGLVESFLNGRVTITALVSPDPAAGSPESRMNVFVSSAVGVDCSVQAWQLYPLPPPRPPAHPPASVV